MNLLINFLPSQQMGTEPTYVRLNQEKVTGEKQQRQTHE